MSGNNKWTVQYSRDTDTITADNCKTNETGTMVEFYADSQQTEIVAIYAVRELISIRKVNNGN